MSILNIDLVLPIQFNVILMGVYSYPIEILTEEKEIRILKTLRNNPPKIISLNSLISIHTPLNFDLYHARRLIEGEGIHRNYDLVPESEETHTFQIDAATISISQLNLWIEYSNQIKNKS